jgi:hypothetical protein
MIRLLARTLPSVISAGDTQYKKTEKERQLNDGRGGRKGGRGAEGIRPPKESLVLFKSFNTLWVKDTFDCKLEVFKG